MPIERTRTRSLRDEQRSFTRSRLLESAAEVIGREGFAGATVADIADTANASRATFYLHFKDKDDLLAAMIEAVRPDIARYYARLDEVIASGERRALATWVRDALDWFADHEATVLALEEALLANPRAAPTAADFTTHMPRYVARWPDAERPTVELRVLLAVQLLSRTHMLRQAQVPAESLGDDHVRDVLTDALWATLGLDHVPCPHENLT